MNRVNRRQFIRAAAAALAASAAGAAVQSCSAGRPGAGSGRNDAVARAARRVSDLTKTMLSDTRLSYHADTLRRLGCSPFLLQESLVSLLVIGAYRDFAPDEREHPEARRLLADHADIIGRATIGMSHFLSSLPPEKKANLRANIVKHLGTLDRLRRRFDAECRKRDVPEQRLGHMHSIVDQCLWRLTSQDPEAVIDECIAMVGKTERSQKLSEAERALLLTQWARRDSFFDTPERWAEAFPDEMASTAVSDAAAGAEAKRSSGGKAARVGLILMGIGVFMFIAGLLIARDGAKDERVCGLVGGMTGGAVLLMVGLIVLIVGLAV